MANITQEGQCEHIGGEKTLKAFFEQNGMPL